MDPSEESVPPHVREVLTASKAAKRAGVSRSLIYAACRKRLLPHYRVGVNGGGKILIAAVDLDAWIATCRVREAEPTAGPPLRHVTPRR